MFGPVRSHRLFENRAQVRGITLHQTPDIRAADAPIEWTLNSEDDDADERRPWQQPLGTNPKLSPAIALINAIDEASAAEIRTWRSRFVLGEPDQVL